MLHFRRYATLAALPLLLATTSANAASIITIDDFSLNDQSLSDNTVDLTPVTQTVAARTLSVDLLASAGAITPATADVSVGELDVNNGTGEDSQVKVTWTVAPNLIPLASQSAAFTVTIVASDANPTTIVFKLDGNPVGNAAIPGNTLNTTIEIPLNVALFNAGGTLVLEFDGAPGWDATLDSIGIVYTPEPGTLALLGVALAGLAAARRRR